MRDGKYFACLLAANCWAGLEPGLNSSIIPALNIRIILSWRYLACQASYLQSTIYRLELLICDLIELLPVETKNSDIPMISIYHNTRISLAWGNKENDRMMACYVMKLQKRMRFTFHGGCPWRCRCLGSGTWLVRRMVQPIHRSQHLDSGSVTAPHIAHAACSV